jgi:preprotein translocase subunit SecA
MGSSPFGNHPPETEEAYKKQELGSTLCAFWKNVMLRNEPTGKHYLLSMDLLKEGIGLRYGQEDPLDRVQREGFDMLSYKNLTCCREAVPLRRCAGAGPDALRLPSAFIQ